ncbi:MAG: CoA-binding protein [Chloroflexi bacterium]|nr:CoA-binding protein [Chloroflexota bacterium]
MHPLERLFNPQSVAVVGSKKVDNHNWLRTVLPFKGPKYHVNVDRNEWESAAELGIPSYASILDVPDPVDYVIFSIPAPVVPRVLKDCITKGVYGVHLYTAGFSESHTEQGAELERQIVEMARAADLKLVGPNCLGIFNPKAGIGVNLGSYYGEAGNFGFISMSGSQAGGFVRGALVHGIKVSKVVSMGNGIILDSADYLEYLAQDDDTKVIGMYLEGVRDGQRFFRVLREACAKKPVLIWKVGETEDAARAVESHTTTKSTQAVVWDAMLRQCGAIKVSHVDEMYELGKLLLKLPPVTGNRVGLFALSGGHATEMTNVFSKAGFHVTPLTDASYRRILEHFDPTGSSYSNPFEGRALANLATLNNILDVVNEDPNVDMIIHEMHVRQAETGPTVYRGYPASFFVDFYKNRCKKPYVAVLSTIHPRAEPSVTDQVYRELSDAGIPTVFGLQTAADALRMAVGYYRYQEE